MTTENEDNGSFREELSKNYDILEQEANASEPSGNTDSTPDADTDLKSPAEESSDIEVAEQPPIDPPHSWTAEMKEKFRTLPRDLQAYAVQRDKETEAALQQKSRELAELKKDNLDPVFSKYESFYKQKGLTRAQAIEQLFIAQQRLDQDPVNSLRIIANSYGLTPQQFLNQVSETGASQTSRDPQVVELQRRLDLIQGKLSEREQAEERSFQLRLVNEVQQFANEMDERGQPKRPHIGRVYENMLPLIAHFREKNPAESNQKILDMAYDKAVRLDDELYEQEKARLIQEREQERINEAKLKAKNAQRAGSSISGSPGSGQQSSKTLTIREELERNWDRAVK